MEYVPGRTLRDVLTRRGAAHAARRPRPARPDPAGARRRPRRGPHPPRRQARERDPARGRRRQGRRLRARPRRHGGQTTTNASGTLLGTVAYLSPEQVERGIADARSDVYAAGLVLFEMLTGRKAFDGDSPIHVAYQHVHGAVPMPSTSVPTVPPALDQLVALATARDPDKRPTNARRLPRRGPPLAVDDDDRRAGPPPRRHTRSTTRPPRSRPGSAATSRRRRSSRSCPAPPLNQPPRIPRPFRRPAPVVGVAGSGPSSSPSCWCWRSRVAARRGGSPMVRAR